MVNDRDVEEENDHYEIELRGIDFKLFDEDEKGVGREGSSEFPYLLMLIKLWPGDCKTQMERIDLNLNEDNGKATGTGNRQYQKVHRFLSNKFWKNIGCLVSAPTFGLRGSMMCEKEEETKISGEKRKKCSIKTNADLYEVCLSCIIYFILFYFMNIHKLFTPAIFVVYLPVEERSLESIGQKYLSQKWTRQHINDGGKSF